MDEFDISAIVSATTDSIENRNGTVGVNQFITVNKEE